MTSTAEDALFTELEASVERSQELVRRLRALRQPTGGMSSDDQVLLASLDSVSLPAFDLDTARDWQDIRTAYILQSFLNMGRDLTQDEAKAIVMRAGYPSGAGANRLYGAEWLVSDVSDGRSSNRRVGEKGKQWLARQGRRALLAWLRS
jgi:hypothetical protein